MKIPASAFGMVSVSYEFTPILFPKMRMLLPRRVYTPALSSKYPFLNHILVKSVRAVQAFCRAASDAKFARRGYRLGTWSIVASTCWPHKIRCCQSNRNSSPIGEAMALSTSRQLMRDCHPANAAEQRSL